MVTRQSIGLKLRGARERLGWSQGDVAQKLGIPRPRLVFIEQGQRPVDSVLLWRFAELYGKRLVDFLSDDRQPKQLPVTLRGHGLSDEARVELERVYSRACEYAALERRLGTPRHTVPLYVPVEGRAIDQGEELAIQERRRLGLGDRPVDDVFALLESQGIQTFPVSCNGDLDGGFFFSQDVGPCVFLSSGQWVRRGGSDEGAPVPQESTRLPSFRWRFTVAHEYCHTLVDKGLRGAVCKVGEQGRQRAEIRANAFAAAFLMPRGALEDVVRELGRRPSQAAVLDVIRVMWHFRVSFQAVCHRLENLGLARAPLEALAGVKGSIVKTMCKLGYDPQSADREFGDWVKNGHRRRCFQVGAAAYQKGLISLGKLAELLDLPREDTAELLTEFGLEVRTADA